MKIAIIITTPDHAGINIKQKLLDNYPFQRSDGKLWNYNIYWLENKLHDIRLYTTDEKCVFVENPEKDIDADMFLFPTTHRSSANTNSLSVHTQGNWDKADLGGSDRNLSYCPADYLKAFFIELSSLSNGLDEQITMEVTHHGPKIEAPTVFLEIGSDEKQWKRDDLGYIISETIMRTLGKEIRYDKTAIGLGGPHYCNNFNKIQLKSDIAIGHICPKYKLLILDKEMMIQAIQKTTPKPELAILDWKGLGSHKQRIKEILDDIGIKWMKTKQVM